jgi:hypothetical protein
MATQESVSFEHPSIRVSEYEKWCCEEEMGKFATAVREIGIKID